MASVDTIVVGTEAEALILEANLIKEHRPRFNVQLRDDKRLSLRQSDGAGALSEGVGDATCGQRRLAVLRSLHCGGQHAAGAGAPEADVRGPFLPLRPPR